MRLNTSKEDLSKTEFDDLLMNMSLNQQDFFKISDRKPPLKHLEEKKIKAFELSVLNVEKNLNLIPEGYVVKSQNNDLMTDPEREYRSAGQLEPLERMPSINLSKISTKPEYSSGKDSKGSKSNHNSASSADQGAQKQDPNLTLSFECPPAQLPESKPSVAPKQPMETIMEQKSGIEENSFDQQSQLEDEFYFFEKKFCKELVDTKVHSRKSVEKIPDESIQEGNQPYNSNNEEEDDDDFVGKYFGGVAKNNSQTNLGATNENKAFSSQNEMPNSYRSKYSSHQLTDNHEYGTANFNSKFSFNPETHHLKNQIREADDEIDCSHEESFNKEPIFNPEELKQVKRSEQLLGFNREDLSENKLEETPQLSNLTYSQKRTDVKDNPHFEDEDEECDRLIVKNIFKDYTSRELDTNGRQDYPQIYTSRDEQEDEEEYEPIITYSQDTNEKPRQSQQGDLKPKNSMSESDSITIDVHYDRESSNYFDEKPALNYSRQAQSTSSVEKVPINQSQAKERVVPQPQNEFQFRKKQAAGVEVARPTSEAVSKQSSIHHPSSHRGEEERRYINPPKTTDSSFQDNRSFTNYDLMKPSVSHSTSLLDDYSRNYGERDRHRSIQSTLSSSTNMKTSDGKLISYSMQISLSGK